MIAPPCLSWSVARNRTKVLRTKAEPLGLASPALPFSQHELGLLKAGNAEARGVARLVRFLHAQGVPWIIENPWSSNIWYSPAFEGLRRLEGTSLVAVDQCSCGTAWRKRTGLLCGHLSPVALESLERLSCSGRRVCQYSGQPHLELVGKRMTTRAAEFPARLSRALARALVTSCT